MNKSEIITSLYIPLYEFAVHKVITYSKNEDAIIYLALYLWVLESSAESMLMLDVSHIPKHLKILSNDMMQTFDLTIMHLKMVLDNKSNSYLEIKNLFNKADRFYSHFISASVESEYEWFIEKLGELNIIKQFHTFENKNSVQIMKFFRKTIKYMINAIAAFGYTLLIKDANNNEEIDIKIVFKYYDSVRDSFYVCSATDKWKSHFASKMTKKQYFRAITFVSSFIKNSIIFMRIVTEEVGKFGLLYCHIKDFKNNLEKLPLTSLFLKFIIEKINSSDYKSVLDSIKQTRNHSTEHLKSNNKEYLVNLMELCLKFEPYGARYILYLFDEEIVREYTSEIVYEEIIDKWFEFLALCSRPCHSDIIPRHCHSDGIPRHCHSRHWDIWVDKSSIKNIKEYFAHFCQTEIIETHPVRLKLFKTDLVRLKLLRLLRSN